MNKIQAFQRFQKDVAHIFSERETTQTWNEIHACSYLQFGDNWNEEKYLDMLSRLNNHEPFQYIIGRAYFYDFELSVTPATLIPRSETEELVALILEDFGGSSPKVDKDVLHVLDIGTGSGCIAIALAKKLKNADVEAMDVSKEALGIARQNADEVGVRVDFLEQNVLDLKGFRKTYDVIVSNPPYIPQKEKSIMSKNVLAYEPQLALFVEDNDPLIFYRIIANLAFESLSVNGALYFECNEFNATELQSLLLNMRYKDVTLHRDLQNKNRMIRAIK